MRLGLAVAVEVLELYAQQAPERLEAACLRWVQRYAAEARGQRLDDYGRIAVACSALRSEPDFGTDELVRLCEERGLAYPRCEDQSPAEPCAPGRTSLASAALASGRFMSARAAARRLEDRSSQ